MIDTVTIDRLKDVVDLFRDVTDHMVQRGIDQWDEVYPESKILEHDINNRSAYGYFIGNRIIGYLALNEIHDEAYKTVHWKFKDDKPLIVHRLAVMSKFQRQGIAKLLMIHAEAFARAENYKTIRLDAYSMNPSATGLYRMLGYDFAGEVKFRKGVFLCFEKKVEN